MTTDSSTQIEGLRSDFHAKICESFSNGMSVIEISNLFGYTKINFVHGVLRDAKLIRPMSKKGPQRSHDIDARLQQGLDKRGYSFARWCVGWGFDPIEVALTLKEKPADGVSYALDAVRRDLPEIYFEIFEGRPSIQKTWQEKKVYPRLSLNIAWDEVRRGYVASVPETPGVEAIGYNWADALEKMESVQRLMRNISLLDSVLQNCGTSEDGK
jgi:predicted RNase H-like HicB family nuclease